MDVRGLSERDFSTIPTVDTQLRACLICALRSFGELTLSKVLESRYFCKELGPKLSSLSQNLRPIYRSWMRKLQRLSKY